MKKSFDLIIFSGAPGSGKSTVCKILQKRLNCPLIDFGWIREFHLDREWKNANKKEEQMSFENLVFILKNYINNGYKDVIVNDLQDFRIEQIPKRFTKNRYIIISLIVKDDNELKNRVLGERDSGFKDFKAAISWNKKIIDRKSLKNEIKVDNTHNSPEKTVESILKIIQND